MSRSVLNLALAAAVLTGCTAGPLPPGSRVSFAGANDLAMPVEDMVSRKFKTVVRQAYDFSCGSAALATLLSFHYGLPETERTSFLGMWRDGNRTQIRKLGFSLLDMKRYLAAQGLAAEGYKVTLAEIAAARTPGIALVNIEGYRHFVVVKGIEGGDVLVGDPSLGLRLYPAREFLAAWNGIYFAIDGRTATARASFGRANDWALAPKGRVLATMEPVSQQALALTRPLPGEL